MRTVLIFPELENCAAIDAIRRKYDPLFGLIAPHLTLVFPFEWDIGDEALARLLDARLTGFSPFDLELCGVGRSVDRFGNFLYWNVAKGVESLVQLHDELAAHEFRPFDSGFPYHPHLTLGKLPDADALNRAYEEVRGLNLHSFTRIHRISAEKIGPHGESTVFYEKEL